MLTQILLNTPPWVWAVLLLLTWLGSAQLFPRVASRARVVRVSLLMAAFSLYGMVSAFGAAPPVLACWLAAASVVGYAVLRMPLAAGTRYLAKAQSFALPGSWAPLALMLGIFALKYSVGILSAMQAPLVHAALFGPLLGLLYGGFSGVFLGRAGRLVLLARRS